MIGVFWPKHYMNCSPLHSCCMLRLIFIDIIWILLFDKGCKLWWCLVCSFLHSLITVAAVGPNMLLSTLMSNTSILFSILGTEDLHSPPLPITELLNLYELGGWEDALWSGWKQEFARFNLPLNSYSSKHPTFAIFFKHLLPIFILHYFILHFGNSYLYILCFLCFCFIISLCTSIQWKFLAF